jgi:hypothetical protein
MNRHCVQWLLIAALATVVLPLLTAQQVTVAQLEQFFAAERAARATDSDIAEKLISAELSEQLTERSLAQIKAAYTPGEKTAEALDVIADESEFLDPPAGELPEKSAPSAAEQQQIILAAGAFATNTLSHLPDYLATRTTRSFEDVPIFTGNVSMQSGLHLAATSVREVTYRNGREISSRALDPGGSRARSYGPHLDSEGEFGPVLKIIVSDSAKGRVSWSHWEQTSAGEVAVFTYNVPNEASHYRIDFCCAFSPADLDPRAYHGTPAYHGTLSIDPTTGAILRVTLQAEFAEFQPQPEVRLMVEYRRVEISGSSLICPVKGVNVSQVYTFDGKRYWTNFFVNETRFTNYHRFGSTVRMLDSATN